MIRIHLNLVVLKLIKIKIKFEERQSPDTNLVLLFIFLNSIFCHITRKYFKMLLCILIVQLGASPLISLTGNPTPGRALRALIQKI
jgi:hypothetical protein